MPASPLPAQREKVWTVEEVRALIDTSADGTRYELVDGALLVSPSPSVWHQEAVGLLRDALYRYVTTWKLGRALASPSDVTLSPRSITQPDVYVLPAHTMPRVRKTRRVREILLAIEVVSPGSAWGDRVKKRKFYQRHRVPEYWIVDLDARLVERWRPGDRRPEILTDRLTWHPEGAAEPWLLALAPFFAEAWWEG